MLGHPCLSRLGQVITVDVDSLISLWYARADNSFFLIGHKPESRTSVKIKAYKLEERKSHLNERQPSPEAETFQTASCSVCALSWLVAGGQWAIAVVFPTDTVFSGFTWVGGLELATVGRAGQGKE